MQNPDEEKLRRLPRRPRNRAWDGDVRMCDGKRYKSREVSLAGNEERGRQNIHSSTKHPHHLDQTWDKRKQDNHQENLLNNPIDRDHHRYIHLSPSNQNPNTHTLSPTKGNQMGASDICLLVLAIFFPPLAVLLRRGCGTDLLINIILTLLGDIPGVIHACFIVLSDREKRRAKSRQPVHNDDDCGRKY